MWIQNGSALAGWDTTNMTLVRDAFREWAAAGISRQLDNPEMRDMCFEEIGLTHLQDVINAINAADVALRPS